MQTYLIVILVLVALIAMALGYVVFYLYKRNLHLEREYNFMQNKVKSLQLDKLESRLDPHLFKNILNSVQSLAYQTYFSLEKMAGVLDYIMYDSQNKMVTLRQEHEFALKLIDINKIKLSPLFELSIRSVVDTEDELYMQELIAPLICVELIENAFKHADLQSEDAFISILFKLKNGVFDLSVSNKSSPKHTLKKEFGGFGLTNLKQRMELIYQEYFTLEMGHQSQVFSVHLKIDLHGFKNKMRHS